MEQATELLKWTVNNTRDNMNFSSKKNSVVFNDVYDNNSLMGFCGFSQFSSLYPLQQLGLEITINNMMDVCELCHCYGTVTIPIRVNGQIIKKRFLIDCTYRQFFTLPDNVVSRYLNNYPLVGFFSSLDEKYTRFSKELLKNGFVEVTNENIKNYLNPFLYSCISPENIEVASKKINDDEIVDILERKQVKFDFTKEEFENSGCNLDFISQKGKKM